MFFASFTDELGRHREPLTKVAGLLAPKQEHLVERMVAAGALSSGAMHGLKAVHGGLSRDPYAMPQDSLPRDVAKGAIGGLVAALGLKTLGKLHGHK